MIGITISGKAYSAIRSIALIGSIGETQVGSRLRIQRWLPRDVVIGCGTCANRARVSAASFCDWRSAAPSRSSLDQRLFISPWIG